MTDKTNRTVDEIINRQRRLLAAAEQIKNLMTEFPELNGTTVNGTGDAGGRSFTNGSDVATDVGGRKNTRFQTIRHWFITHSNAWLSAPDIASQLGLKKTSVTQVLWVLNKDAFEKRDAPGSRKKKEFRLKAPVTAK